MAKVKGPLHSDKASGTFGKVLQFRCGEFVLKAQKEKEEKATGGQNFQREKFRDGANVWKNVLTAEQRTAWENFAKSIVHEKGWYKIKILPGIVVFGEIGKKKYEVCITTIHWNGYQYFQSARDATPPLF